MNKTPHIMIGTVIAVFAFVVLYHVLRSSHHSGIGSTSEKATHTTLPATERFGDALGRGARLRPVEPSDLSAEFEARLVDVCRADPNVAGLWLVWMSSSGAAPEMLATLLLDRPDELAIRDFIKRADALGGPPFVAAIPRGIPSAKPFYRREEEIPGAEELCAQCGHPLKDHRILGILPSPTEGWMDCPVEGCTCKMNWRLDPP